jgi:nucleotide-binding universal stress UspA family protein
MTANRQPHQFWKLLVAVDGSRGSVAALRFTANLARCAASARVTVMTVAASSAPKSPEVVHANRLVDAAAETLRSAGVQSERRIVSIRPGDSIPEAIRRESDRMRSDLVVIGSEGRDTLREWVVGGVALRLLYLSRRPVVVVRPSGRRKVSKQLAHSELASGGIPTFAAHQLSPSGSDRGGGA